MKNNRWLPIIGIVLIILIGGGMALGAALPANVRQNIIIGRSGAVASPTAVATTGTGIAVSGGEVDLAADSVTYRGVLRSIDTDEKKIDIYVPDDRKEMTFNYDTITEVKTARGVETVMESLPMGDIVDAQVMSGSGKMLLSVIEDPAAWDYSDVRNFDVDQTSSVISIGSRKYSYDAGGISVFSGMDPISLDDIDISKDVVDIRGIDKKVMSINVTRGHGVLDFRNYDEFIGGNIEVGYSVFDTISDNMKYTIPEGTYKVHMTNGGLAVNKVVKIKRGETTVLDLSKYASSMKKKSSVRFNIAPYDATLYIDGKQTEFALPVTLEFGEYLVRVECEGYKDYSTILKINRARQEINISLVSKDVAATGSAVKTDTSSVSDSKETRNVDNTANSYANNQQTGNKADVSAENTDTVDKSSAKDSSTSNKETATIPVKTETGRKISFRNPTGATVYLDGTKMGTVPCETTKVTGEHVIMLSKSGYTSQNYTVDIEDDNQDTIFSFPELTKN